MRETLNASISYLCVYIKSSYLFESKCFKMSTTKNQKNWNIKEERNDGECKFIDPVTPELVPIAPIQNFFSREKSNIFYKPKF